MPLTRDFYDTVRARAARDPEFRAVLLDEVIRTLLRVERFGDFFRMYRRLGIKS